MDTNSIMKTVSCKRTPNYLRIKRIGKFLVGENKAVVRKETIKIWNENPNDENNWMGGTIKQTITTENIRDMFTGRLLLKIKDAKKESTKGVPDINTDGTFCTSEKPLLLHRQVTRKKGCRKTKTIHTYESGLRRLKIDNKKGETYYDYRNGLPE